MTKRSDREWSDKQAGILGLGVTSTRKTYYPALRKRLVELEHTEANLRASHDRLESLIGALPDWIWETDARGVFTYCSPQIERLVGYRQEEALGRSPDEFLAPDEPEAIRESLRAKLSQQDPFSGLRAAHRHRDGSRVIFETSGVPIFDEEGAWRGCRGIHRDVTSRILTEERLERTQFAVDGMSDAAFWIAPDSRLVEVNDAACQSLGYTCEELLTKCVADVDAIATSDLWPAFWTEMKRDGRRRFESRHRRKDGTEFSVEVSVRYVRFGGKEYHFSVVRDISERKQREAELADARAMLEAAIEQSPAGILIADAPDVRIRIANTAALEIRGAGTETLTGIDVDAHVERWQTFRLDGTPCDPRELPLSRALLGGETVRDEEVIIRHVDGTDRRVLTNAAPVRGPNGEIRAAVVVFLDITRHRMLEHQLNQSQKMEAVGRLAGGVAHDLNNLLSPVLGYAELLLSDLPEGDSRRVAADEIHAAALRSRDLVRQLLAFGRKQALVVQTVDLNQVVAGFEPFLQRTIREDVSIISSLAPRPLPFAADARQIEQVLLNLAINAQDAMPEGGRLTIETAEIEIDETYASTHLEVSPGRYVMLAISDTGSGMDETTRERIFDPFFTTKELGQGTGLGLATVYGIVKQHGGSIWLRSEPDQGSMFRCYFPAASEPAVSPENAPSSSIARRGHETIMIAEDNVMVRKLAAGILQRKGYTVLSASGGTECLDKLAEHQGPVDLLLTDVIMPDINGRALYEQVKGSRPEIKVLFMSGYTEDVIVHHGVLSEGIPFLQKPFTIQGLSDKVRQVLDE